MSDNRSPTVYNDNIFRSLARQVRLAWRLFLDPRVHWMAKALPVISAIYVISPVDLIPAAVLPFIGTMDDLAIAVFGLKLFIEFSPAEVVQEHLQRLIGSQGGWDVVKDTTEGSTEASAESQPAADDVVEGEYSVVDDEP